MAFTGYSFIYNGISSEQFGLMLCDFENAKQEAGKLGAGLSIQEDRIARRTTSLHYGVIDNTAKSFPLVFVSTDPAKRLDRYDIAQVASWLSGHSDYKELVVLEPHMEGVFYRCIMTDIEQIEVGKRTIGFTATACCDGPYAYLSRKSTVYHLDGTTTEIYRNGSNVNDYYYPTMELICTGSNFALTNQTDGTAFVLNGMPSGDRTIQIDTLNQVMTSSDDINLYEYWNTDMDKYFPRFLRGDNRLTLEGNGSLTIQNVFPWNVGN